MADTLYVNKPGGVIVPTQDGGTKTLAYGDVWPDDAQPYVDASRFADAQPRVSGSATQLEAAAHARAAKAENGQVNSASSPVPGNYNDLPEDAAALLVANLERYPEAQATVLVHEILYGGNRQKVLDAASQRAQISAHAQIAAEVVGVANDQRDAPRAVAPPDPSVSPGDEARTQAIVDAPTEVELPPPSNSDSHAAGVTGEPNRFDAEGVGGDLPPEDQALLARSGRRGSAQKVEVGEDGEPAPATEFDSDGVIIADLDAYVEQHSGDGSLADYPKNGTKDEKIAFLNSAHGSPQTPLNQ